MKQVRIYILLGIAWLMSSMTWAQGVYYMSNQLQEISRTLGISKALSELPDGFVTVSVNGTTYIIEKDHGRIFHIGYPLFTKKQRTSIGKARCNFVERFLLSADLPLNREKSVEQEMKEEKIIFRTGNLSTLKNIIGDTTITVTAQIFKDKAHVLKWSRFGKTICEIAFPMDHELMRGVKMQENDERMQMEILMTPMDEGKSNSNYRFCQVLKRDSIYIAKNKSFSKTSLSGDRYFVKDSVGSFKVLYNEHNIAESIANLFTDNDITNSYALEINQKKYNYETKTYTVPLNQWIEYCKEQGCIPYFGIIKNEDQIWECLLVMQQPHMGYCHLMRIQFDISTIKDKKGKMSVRLNPFIPTSNIKDINYLPQ